MPAAKTFAGLLAARRRRLRQSLTQASELLTRLVGADGSRISRALVHAWGLGRVPGPRYTRTLALWLVISEAEVLALRRRALRARQARKLQAVAGILVAAAVAHAAEATP